MTIRSVSIEALEEAHLLRLIGDGVAESAELEYKRDSYGGRDQDKKEFLKDASAFANTDGGDIVIGMEEAEGIPVNLIGVAGINVDAEILRLDNLLRDAVQPRLLGVQWRPVPLAGGQAAIVLRIPRSLNGPHRVAFQGWNKFFVRNAAGVHEVSVDELRDLFLSAHRLEERVRAFRIDRIMKLKSGETPRPVVLRPGVLLHIVPLSALASGASVDVLAAYDNCAPFVPIGASGCSNHFNFDGMLTTVGDADAGRPISAYCQLFRNGCVETVRGYGRECQEEDHVIAIPPIEGMLVAWTRRIVAGLSTLGVRPPFVVMPGLLGVHDLTVTYDRLAHFDPPLPFDRDDLILPELLLMDATFVAGWADTFKPLFDANWQGVGFRGSPGFNSEGRWRGDQ